MADPSHSATTGPSASDLEKFNGDARIIAPFFSIIDKPCSQRTQKDLYISPGHRRQSLSGNPVLVGTIQLAGFEEFKPPLCVTGDTDDEDDVTLTIQAIDQHGRGIPVSEEIPQKAMKKAQALTQEDIMRKLEVPSNLWEEMVKKHWTKSCVAHAPSGNPLATRAYYFPLFQDTISKYVLQTLSHQRFKERKRFENMLSRPNGLAKVYKECGWTDLAERKDLAKMDPVKLAKEYDDLCLRKSAIEELAMQPF